MNPYHYQRKQPLLSKPPKLEIEVQNRLDFDIDTSKLEIFRTKIFFFTILLLHGYAHSR